MPEPLLECQKVFESLGDYRDSKDKLEECKQRVKDAEEKKLEDLYRFNRDLMHQDDIDMCKRAQKFFEDNYRYKDCNTWAVQCKAKVERLEREKQKAEDAILRKAHRLEGKYKYDNSQQESIKQITSFIQIGIWVVAVIIGVIMVLLENC